MIIKRVLIVFIVDNNDDVKLKSLLIKTDKAHSSITKLTAILSGYLKCAKLDQMK